MLPGLVTGVKRFDINSIFNVHDRVGMYYGHSITEMVNANKIAIERNQIQNVSSFEDAIGTIPLVNHEQPVGLILDRSLKLQRSSELIAGTDLSAFTPLGTASNGADSITTTDADTGVIRDILIVGNWYEVVVEYTGTTTDEFTINTYDSGSEAIREIRVGEGKAIFRAEYSHLYLKHAAAGVTSGLSVSLKIIPGHHLVQDTEINRPVLSYRVNRVLSSEDLNDIVWTNTNLIIDDEVLAPDGTLTAFSLKNTPSLNSKLTQSIDYFTGQHGQYYRTIYVKPGAEAGATIVFEGVGGAILASYVAFNTSTRAFTLSTNLLDDYGYEELEDGWLLVWLKITQASDKILSNNIFIGSQTNTATQHEVLVWHPDTRLEIHNNSRVPTYQATYADETIDTVNFPAYLDITEERYLRTDVDLTAANRVIVLSSFALMNNETEAIYLEYGTDSNVDDGSFAIKIPESANTNAVIFRCRGNVVKNMMHHYVGILPRNFSMIGYSDLDLPELKLTINKINKPTITSTLGTGSFSGRPLFLFRRNGATMHGEFHVFKLPTILFMDSTDPGLTKGELRELKKITNEAIKA